MRRKNHGTRKHGVKGGKDNKKWSMKDKIFLLQNRTLVATDPQLMCQLLDRKMSSIQNMLKSLLSEEEKIEGTEGNAIILTDKKEEDVVVLTKEDYDKLYEDFQLQRKISVTATAFLAVASDALVELMGKNPELVEILRLAEKAKKGGGMSVLTKDEQLKIQERINNAGNLVIHYLPYLAGIAREEKRSFNSVINGQEEVISDELCESLFEFIFKNSDTMFPHNNPDVRELRAS